MFLILWILLFYEGKSSQVLSFGKSKSTNWESIVYNVRKRNYSRAIKGLYYATKGTQRNFHAVVKNCLRRNKGTSQERSVTFKEVTLENISKFSWNDVLEQLDISASLCTSVLKDMVCAPKEQTSICPGNKKNLKPAVGFATSTLLHANAPRKASFLPAVCSIQLWRGGLQTDKMKQFSQTGICFGIMGTRTIIDNIRTSFDVVARKTTVWRTN